MRSRAGANPFSLEDPTRLLKESVRFLRTTLRKNRSETSCKSAFRGLDSSVRPAMREGSCGKRTLGSAFRSRDEETREVQDAGQVGGSLESASKTLT